MKTSELVQYRTDLFRNAAAFKKVDHVPHLSFAVTWKVLDAGYTLTEGLRNYDIMTKCICQLLRPTANALEVGACNCPVV